MKVDSLRNTLVLPVTLAAIAVLFIFYPSCKKDVSPSAHLTVITLDSAGNNIMSDVSVMIYVDTTNQSQIRPAKGLPQTHNTDASGSTTFDFDNGVVVYIFAQKNTARGHETQKSYAILNPGDNLTKRIHLDLVPKTP